MSDIRSFGPGLSCGPTPIYEDGEGQDVPRIRDEILGCVLYLYRSPHEAEEGINIGGSGFALSIPCETVLPGAAHLYAVTNKHVIEDGAIHVRLNSKDGRKIIMEAQKKDWITSPVDDLAVVPLVPLPDIATMNPIPHVCLLTREELEKLLVWATRFLCLAVLSIGRAFKKTVPLRDLAISRRCPVIQSMHKKRRFCAR